MAVVGIEIIDADGNVWWEMPPDMVDRLLRAETTNEYAIIARALKDAVRDADEQVTINIAG